MGQMTDQSPLFDQAPFRDG